MTAMTQLIKSLEYIIQQYEKRKVDAKNIAHKHRCTEAGDIASAQFEIWEAVINDLKYTVDKFKENDINTSYFRGTQELKGQNP